MTHLPVHPFTGLTAIGFRRDGRPIYPIRGGSQPVPNPVPPPPGDPAPAPANPPTDPPSDPDNLGDAGKKALDEERKARKAAEKELDKFRKAEQDRADADKSEAEKRTAAEQRATQADLRAMRMEVAFEKGLSAAQAKRLVGSTRDELETDADEIKRDFPTAPTTTAPKPDPSQGPRPGAGSSGREQGLAEARRRFGTPAANTS